MATTEREMMPSDLKERGWKLKEKRVNDSDPEYIAINESRGFETESFPVPATAIAAARKLDTNFSKPAPESDATNPRMVSHSKIRIDGGTQPREKLDEDLIAEYAEAKKNGAKFPPIDLFFDGSHMWLAGGFHRYFADQRNGLTESLATVHEGTRRDAVLFSVRENSVHGLRRSNADKRRAVLTLLQDPEWSKWSDNVIADKADVSQPFVSGLRRDLTQNVLSEHADDAEQPILPGLPAANTRRIGRDGIERETANIGRARESQPDDARSVDDDIIPAETDIQVDDGPPTAEAVFPKPSTVDTPDADRELWENGSIDLHLRLNPLGKKEPGTALVSGKHTNTNPVFLNCTAADLQPMPPAIKEIMKLIAEAFNNRGKSQPAATKRKNRTTVARGKKKATKRPIKSASKKKSAKPATKKTPASKKPAPRPKPKPKVRKK